jgi:aerobic-type carbon monoxide dehydrogenase small subunit (CoxS/CutS family)
MDSKMNFTVNGKEHPISTETQRPLLDVLREDLRLTGTKYGCGEGACGACSVLVDGRRIFACSTPVSDVQGKSITTIEGLADGDQLHPVQEAFLADGAFQCGYCTPGMIIATVALLKRKPNPTDPEIISALNGNLCRCCSYTRILQAVRRAATQGGRT